MDWVPWVIRAVLIVVGIILAIIIWKGKKEGKPQAEYRTFFTLGVTWVPFSIVLMMVSFIFQIPFWIVTPILVIGVVYLIIGLKNRDKWKKN